MSDRLVSGDPNAPHPLRDPTPCRTDGTRSSPGTVHSVACYICGERIIADPALAERLGTCLECAQERALDEDGRERLAEGVLDEDEPLVGGEEPGRSIAEAMIVGVCIGSALAFLLCALVFLAWTATR